MNELIFAPLTVLIDAVRTRQISSHELTAAYLDRITAVNSRLNAVVQLDGERALARAAAADEALARGESWGALHGIPFTIKDSFDTAGVITTWGTPGRANFVPQEDATVVKRLKQAGAILLGKTNTPEFTLSYETDNPVYGRTRNPYDPERMPGGSSGGAVAIVASGGSSFDVGSDTGGSIRLPCHFSGLTGIKPTTGRVPRTGHCPPPGGLVNELTQIGPIARAVGDLALLLPLLAGPDGRDPYIYPVPLGDPAQIDINGLRGAYFIDNGIYPPDAEIARLTQDVVDRLAAAGGQIGQARPAGIEQTLDLSVPLMRGWDGGEWVKLLLSRCGTSLEETSLSRYLSAVGMSPAATIALFDRLDRFRAEMLRFWDEFDYLICPAAAFPALRSGELSEKYAGTSYLMSFNLTGWPAGVVRAGTTGSGLPLGVQVVAPPWREDVVLAVMSWVESAFGGYQRPEPLTPTLLITT